MCTASSECTSGEGCGSHGMCGMYKYLINFWKFCYITRYKNIWWYENYKYLFKSFVSLDPTCTASSDCISGEGCISAGYCCT